MMDPPPIESPPEAATTTVDFSQLIALPVRANTSSELLGAAMAGQPAFESVPIEALSEVLGNQGLEVLELERDQLLPVGEASSFYYVCEGQVAMGVFRQEDIDERQRRQDEREAMSDAERSLLPLPPLARTAHKNLARFRQADIFDAGAIARTAGDIALYSLTPIRVLRFTKEAIASLTASHPPFSEALRTSLSESRALLGSISGVKQEILDFYLRHGLSVSGPSVRVRQLDLCIDCKQCEDACEERHAAKRLTLGGFRLGMLDFVFSCRTCEDQRCLSPCEHDSISFDRERSEVIIDHAKCIGCSLCAQSCPYGAIDMVNVAEEEEETFNFELKARLTAKGALAHGPGTSRSDSPRRVANKCDHCEGFAEQACVSACPTGSLVELDMARLFGTDRARPGQEALPIGPFRSSVGVKDAGLARIRIGSFSTWMWWLGLLSWSLVAGEILLRHFAPTLSLRYHLLIAQGLAPGLAKLGVGYLPGSHLALLCAYTGAALIVISMAYPLRRRLRFFRKSASNKYWLDLHIMSGTVGPLFILLHSALRLDNWVSVPFGSMLMVVGSGFLGRFLYTLIPSMTYAHDIENLALHSEIRAITAEQPSLASSAKEFISADLARVRTTQHNPGLRGLLLWLLRDEVQRLFVHAARRKLLRGHTSGDAARALVSLCGRLCTLERRRVLAPRARTFLKTWKYIHIPFAVLMLATTVVHIVLAILYSM